MTFQFQEKYTDEEQKKEATRVLRKYPDRIPVIAEIFSDDLPKLDKNKYLIPRDLTLGQFLYVIRKRIKLKPEKGLYLFINNKIFSSNKLISQIYETESKNMFLFISIHAENTFGNLN